MKINDIKPEIYNLSKIVEEKISCQFEYIDSVSMKNTERVMQAFQDKKVSESCFAGTTGYGYDDIGRDTLDKIFAQIFGTENALVRLGFVNGTHAITAALFSLAAPGQTILSVTGEPYDTLRKAIGINNVEFGSLNFYGINYRQIELKEDGSPDYNSILETIKNDRSIKAVIVQRSCGYSNRKALTIEDIRNICSVVSQAEREIYVFVDNCYGEFTDIIEPPHVGADLIAGSLIKNPGGGLAPTGAYIAGKKTLVDRAAARMTSPGIGGECGSTLGNNRLLYQGLFIAPHTVAQALKTAVFASAIMREIGIECFPGPEDKRSDIIQRIMLGSEEKMKRFCLGIQAGAPVDSYVTPEPWNMPGYDCKVIMADGSFIQGSSIELSADGPVTEPFNVYLQGGITFESGKLGIMMAASAMIDKCL